MSVALKGLLINVSGVVQGVGFRWYARQTADRWGVKGFVRNLYDGSVEIYAEGNEITLEGFLEEIRVGPSYAHIAGVRSDWTEYQGKYKEFRIEL
jgi:acylphosphatase